MTEIDYAGNVSPKSAWRMLIADPAAALIDVRTDAEFAYVGGPDLSGMPNPSLRVSWKLFPSMERNPHFEEAIEEAVPEKDRTLLFLCRSGVRSIATATVMAHRGYTDCYNVLEGFEGDHCPDGHRGVIGGWKVHGLPWRQD